MEHFGMEPPHCHISSLPLRGPVEIRLLHLRRLIYDINFKVRGEDRPNTGAVQPDPTTFTNFIVSMKSVFQAMFVSVNSSSFVVNLATMQARPASAAKCWHSRSKPSRIATEHVHVVVGHFGVNLATVQAQNSHKLLEICQKPRHCRAPLQPDPTTPTNSTVSM